MKTGIEYARPDRLGCKRVDHVSSGMCDTSEM